LENTEGIHDFGDQGIDGRLILRWTLKKKVLRA
jgi:hypothetical protein